jgi:hypothetical protein
MMEDGLGRTVVIHYLSLDERICHHVDTIDSLEGALGLHAFQRSNLIAWAKKVTWDVLTGSIDIPQRLVSFKTQSSSFVWRPFSHKLHITC